MNARFYSLTILLLDKIVSSKHTMYSYGLGAEREVCPYWATALTWTVDWETY